MIAFLDIQTTSNNYKLASIVAFSVVVIDDDRIIHSIERRVKPLNVLSSKEERYSGYSNSELRSQNCFADYFAELVEILGDAVVIFFDKFSEMIWRKSLREIGFPVNKSQQIIQELLIRKGILDQKTSLDSLCNLLKKDTSFNRLGLNANVLAAIYTEYVLADNGSEAINQPVADYKVVTDFDNLPKNPGVYYFFDSEKAVIYVGKAINLKERIKAHFSSKIPFELTLTESTFSIEYKETGNELISLLLESAEIARLKPVYNTQQIEDILPWTIESRIDKKGIFRIFPKEKSYSDNHHSISFNRDSVITKLKNLALQFSLCYRFLGIERTSGSCSSPLCKGVCKGIETREAYNQRAQKAFDSLQSKKESYFLKLPGRVKSEEAFVLVKDGVYEGFGFIPLEYPVRSIADFEAFIEPYDNTYFTNRSIHQYLNKKGIVKYNLP